MRIAVLDAHAPFAPSATAALADELCAALRAHGHAATRIRIPFSPERLEVVVDQLLAARLLHLDRIERLIAIGFPAAIVPHADRVAWLLDAGPTGAARAGAETPLASSAARSLAAAARAHLAQARRVYAGSPAAARALAGVLDDAPALLRPPPCGAARLRRESYDGPLVAFGAELGDAASVAALDALGRTRSAARLVIAGPPQSAAALAALREAAAAPRLAGRVELLERAPDSDERAALLVGARAVLCLAEDPDGPVTVEAFQARKPVIVVAAGPPAAAPVLVRDGRNGLLAAGPEQLAQAIDHLADDAGAAARLGAAGFDALAAAGISWPAAAAELAR